MEEMEMSSENTQETIHCPNCDEDVPETLYCLNCGYPLYKIEKQEEPPEEVEVEETLEEPVEEAVEEAEIVVEDMEPQMEEAEAQMEEAEAQMEESEHQEEIEIQVEEEEEQVEEPPYEPEVAEVPEEEAVTLEEESISQQAIEEQVHEEVAAESATEPSPVEVETTPVSVDDTPLIESEELMAEFAPDPMTREVMENLAKNITLKIRLVKLLESGQVKEETFNKLFDSYVEQGKIWISRRDETMRRFKSDVERMENELVEARKAFELLEIRRSIGDAGDKEYNVKAPAYKWDMEHLDNAIKERKAGVAYLSNLTRLVPEEEVERLKKMASNDHRNLDELENVSTETISLIKDTLNEALGILNQ
ncbi:MAG: hypothetical protein ACLFVP_02825 [Candidatus Bathyarchaeia archaeon]